MALKKRTFGTQRGAYQNALTMFPVNICIQIKSSQINLYFLSNQLFLALPFILLVTYERTRRQDQHM